MRNLKGQVGSTKMQKVATVLVGESFRHPLYKKILRRDFKIHARNEIGAKTGDWVVVAETRPMAKTVNFIIKEILTQNFKQTKPPVKPTEKPKIIKKKINKEKIKPN